MKGKYHVVVQNKRLRYDLHNEKGIVCISAGGKSNLRNVMSKLGKEPALVIADGAAIGSEMNELYQMMRHKPAIKCYLPESFEWLVLRSGIIDGKSVQDILDAPEDFVESQKYFSWERFFTAVLVEYTKDSYLRYSKSKLNKAYLHEKVKQAIMNVTKSVGW